MSCDDCVNWFYYFDHGGNTDWNCGNQYVYGGHTGTDYSLSPRFYGDDNEIIAMAPGTVVYAEDGHADDCTGCCRVGANILGNQVRVDHGTHIVVYAHMKTRSVKVAKGDTVECGQVLGYIGSSGCSNGPHLHFEPYPQGGFVNNDAVDPYEGSCNQGLSASMFTDQGSYGELPPIGCDAVPPEPTCPAGATATWTCTVGGLGRTHCVDGVTSDEACTNGCTAGLAGSDATCAVTADGDGDGSRADVDCNDADPNRHPGAVDVCGDAIDQDCSGADLACPVTGGTSGAGTGGVGTAGIGTAGISGGIGTAGVGTVGGVPTAGNAPGGWINSGPRKPAESGCSVAYVRGHSAASSPMPYALIALLLSRVHRRRPTRAASTGRPLRA